MKVYIYRPCGDDAECAAIAYDEEGRALGGHVSSSFAWAQHDMARHVPPDAEVTWVRSRADLQALIDSGAIRGLSFDRHPEDSPEEEEAG